MKGHVRRRGRTSWAIVLDLGRGVDGRRRQKWHSVRGTREDAERELGRLLNEIGTGAYVEPANISVADYLERWLSDYAHSTVAPKTFERYREIIRSHVIPALGKWKLVKLRPLHVQTFYSDALNWGRKDGKGGLSRQTVVHFHRVLHKAFAHAVKWQLLSRNTIDAVQPPRAERKEMQALDDSEIAKLLQHVDGKLLNMPVLLAVTTGLRRGEILGLRWSDVDLKGLRLQVTQSLEQTSEGLRFKSPKTTRSRRTIALPGLTVEALRAHYVNQGKQRLQLGSAYEGHNLVCARSDGAPWPPDHLSTAFSALVRKSKLKRIRFHDLRHTHATQLLRIGIHPKVVSERLGHSNIGITLDTYSHVLPGMQEAAAEALNMSIANALKRSGD